MSKNYEVRVGGGPINSTCIGIEAKAKSHCVTIAAGEDNQLRFEPDGSVYHNDTLLGKNDEIVERLRDIVSMIVTGWKYEQQTLE